jgi:hypothetical protein
VLRNAWQVESRLAGHVHSIDAAVATLRGNNAGNAVGIRLAGLSEVNLTLFPTLFPDPVSPRHPDATLIALAAGLATQH